MRSLLSRSQLFISLTEELTFRPLPSKLPKKPKPYRALSLLAENLRASGAQRFSMRQRVITHAYALHKRLRALWHGRKPAPVDPGNHFTNIR